MLKLCLGVVIMCLWILSGVCQSTSIRSNSLSHDVRPLRILYPRPHGRLPVGYAAIPVAEFQNVGEADEDSVVVQLLIFDSTQRRIYADSVTIRNWRHGQIRDTTFTLFLPQQARYRFRFTLITSLPDDTNASNDTVSTEVTAQYASDVLAVPANIPANGDTLMQGAFTRLQGHFSCVGAYEFYGVPARCEIRRCSDGVTVFVSDTTIPAMFVDSGITSVDFPLDNDKYHVNQLPPGCYRMAMICRQGDDGNRSNDTSYSFLTIVSRTQPPHHDARPSYIQAPSEGQQVLVHNAIIPKCSVEYSSFNNDSSFVVRAHILDSTFAIRYSDSIVIRLNPAYGSTFVSFKPFIPIVAGMRYTVVVTTELGGDTNPFNDTSAVHFTCRAFRDGSCSAILSPSQDTLFVNGSTFRPTIACKWLTGLQPSTPLEIETLRYSSVFPTDYGAGVPHQISIYPDYFDSSGTVYHFDPEQYCYASNGGGLDTGLHTLAIITHFRDDNRSNDTAWLRYYVRNQVDISVDTILGANQYFQLIPFQPNLLSLQLTNRGILDESNIYAFVTASLEDTLGVYADTLLIPAIPAGKSLLVQCKPLTPMMLGKYHLYATINPRSDANSDNNRISRWVYGRYRNDVVVSSQTYPADGDTLFQATPFPIEGAVALRGTGDLQNVRVRTMIRPCDGGNSVYLADTTISVLTDDGPWTQLSFPETSGPYSTHMLAPGCYVVTIIAEAVDDENRTNDTARSVFTILPDLSTSREVLQSGSSLAPNVPNPFDRTTTIYYSLESAASVDLMVRDVLGRTVYHWRSPVLEAGGNHAQTIELSDAANGTYFLELTTNTYIAPTNTLHTIISRQRSR